MRSSREGAASTQRLCVSQTHLAVEVARSRSRPPRVGRAAASCRLGPARHAGCQVHIAPHAEHTVGPQQGRLGLCPQEQRGTRHTGREHQRSWSLPGIQLQSVLPGESTSAAGLFPRYTGREHQRSWSLPVIAAAEPRGGAGPVGAAGADLVGAAAAGLRGGAAGAGLRGGAASSTERLRGGAAGWPPRRRSGCWPPRRRSGSEEEPFRALNASAEAQRAGLRGGAAGPKKNHSEPEPCWAAGGAGARAPPHGTEPCWAAG